MIVTTAQLYKVAYGKFAVGAYNINNMEQLLGLFGGNLQSRAPFIIQLSKDARNTRTNGCSKPDRYSRTNVSGGDVRVHLDHGDEEACYDCINSGFYSSVMIDASHERFEKNIPITKRVVGRAHAKGISVGAELGMLGHIEQGKSLLRSTPIFIAHKNEKLRSDGQLDAICASVKK
jgi:fructose-bisphosphate aldolase class II